MPDLVIYTDGACSGNPGPGGWGVVATESNNISWKQELSGSELNTTNNRMELTAVIQALTKIPTTYSSILIVTDSKYVSDAINKSWLTNWVKRGWRKSDGSLVLNSDLWMKLDKLLHLYDVKFHWVKGHAGHPENERCDALARSEIKKLRELYG